ncbi:YndM family protein [Gracilibacillus xinjiangensis]|uniref:YndM family protein n=1 Tax=Gracilibacillus xinjiangensis TaxID=1193282 RepID=A0ABV8WSZ9_9BACI
MKHIKLIAVKFLISLALLFVILGMGFDVSFGNVFLITLALGVISYVIGDLLILPRTNNMVATICDFILAYAVIYLMTDALTVGDGVMQAAFISSLGVAVFEYFYHKYVASNLDTDRETTYVPPRELNVETSEEISTFEEENKVEKREE